MRDAGAQVIHREHVARIDHRDGEAIVLHRDRQHVVAAAQRGRHEGHGHAVDRVVRQLDERQVQLLCARRGELQLGHDSLLDKCSDGLLVVFVGRDAVEMFDGQDAAHDEDIGEIRHGTPLNGYGPRGSLGPRSA